MHESSNDCRGHVEGTLLLLIIRDLTTGTHDTFYYKMYKVHLCDRVRAGWRARAAARRRAERARGGVSPRAGAACAETCWRVSCRRRPPAARAPPARVRAPPPSAAPSSAAGRARPPQRLGHDTQRDIVQTEMREHKESTNVLNLYSANILYMQLRLDWVSIFKIVIKFGIN